MTPTVAIIATTSRIVFTDLQRVANAIQKQVTRDVNTIWNVTAVVVACKSVQDAPAGAWITTIEDEIDVRAYGYHYVNEKGLPYARLRYTDDWTLILSHEVVEMLVDPYGNRVMSTEEFGEVVDVLVEIADPSQHRDASYRIDGVMVSDFYTPNYFDLVWTPNTRYSFTGAIKKPKELFEGGYRSYRDRAGEWFQAWQVNGKIQVQKLSDLAKENPVSTFLIIVVCLFFIYLIFKKK